MQEQTHPKSRSKQIDPEKTKHTLIAEGKLNASSKFGAVKARSVLVQ
jgi:hypothetical protein